MGRENGTRDFWWSDILQGIETELYAQTNGEDTKEKMETIYIVYNIGNYLLFLTNSNYFHIEVYSLY